MNMTNEILDEKDFKNRKVAQTKVGDQSVSTVLLMFDHGIFGKPEWFETMVFPDCDCVERYTTLIEAQEGHKKIVDDLSDLNMTNETKEDK